MGLIRHKDSWPVLPTVDAVVEALGGTSAAAAIGNCSNQQISNAKKLGTFPPKTFLLFQAALEARSLQAPAALWRIEQVVP
jgi:hypothetical protein